MLRKLMLAKKRETEQAKLDALLELFKEFAEREAELEQSIGEIKTEEESEVVEGEIDKFEAEKKEKEAEKENLEKKLKEIDEELEELEKEQPEEVSEEENKEAERTQTQKFETREKGVNGMKTREMVLQERCADLVKLDEVRAVVDYVREAVKGVKNGEMVIPKTVVDVVRGEIEDYSKLLKYVDYRKVAGKSKVLLVGDMGEAIWIETCTNLNELGFEIYNVEIDGATVGGFVPLCRATIEDSEDIDILAEVITGMARAIAKALDKAVLYGTGKKMPKGIVTRLAEESKPESHDEKVNGKWIDLHTTNIVQINEAKEKDLFVKMAEAAGKIKANSKGREKVWFMNEATKNVLIAKFINFNAAGAIVTGMQDVMPVIGGKIETLEDIPNGDIIGGYFKQYLLAERAGVTIEASDHVRFLSHHRVFKGLARYDGAPISGAGFVAMNINNVAVTKTVQFPEDEANKAEL